MNKPIDYQAKKQELNELMTWFESDDAQINDALAKYQKAEEIINELEMYLKDTKAKIDILVKHSSAKK